MSVTCATSHAEMSALNEVFPLNNDRISVMAETSHVPMAGEHTPTGESMRHAPTAATRAAFVVYTGRECDGGGDGGGGGGHDGSGGDGNDGGCRNEGAGGGGSAAQTEPIDPVNT